MSASNHIQYITGLEGGDVVDNKRTAEVKASTSLPFAVGSVDAEGKYVIQCGFTSDAQCGDVNTLGVGNDACCYGRPNVISEKPISSGVCRNTMMTAEFNEKIYPNSLTDNVSVYIKTNTEEACTKAGGTVTQKFTKNINDPWYRRAWLSVVNFVREMLDVEPAYALFDCEGVVDFEIQLADAQEIIEGKVVNRSKLFIIPTEVLKANTTYYVNLGKDIKNEKSISMHQDKSWQFTTGLEVCDIDRVSVEPGKYVFFVPGIEGAGNFIAIAETVINGVAQPLIQTNDYEWEWSWLVSNETIAQIENVSDDGDVVIVSALPNKGSAILRATATITHDTFFNPSTVENEYYGIAELTNTMCENPWPEYQNSQFPLIDSSHNFSTWYCRGNGTQDLLPGLTKGQLVSTADDPNLLKAFFLQNQDNGDAIGVRVQKNLKHLSPMDWYNEQGFPGNPEVIEIDGYQAIVDGATIYISAVNVATENNNHKLTPGSNDKGKFNERYTNIYIISHNDTASAETKIIYKQLIDNLEFNVNLNKEWDQGVCASIKESKKAYNILQPEIQCTSELECLAEAPTAEEKIIPGSEEYIDCLSVKKQMQRDMVRLSDLQKIKQAVEIYKMQNTNAPLLQQGTYIPSMSVSAWDSWQAQLGSVLGIEMPLDPLNEFRIGCAESGANSENCWNSGSQQYQCMKRSHVYAYQSTEGGLEYKLKAELESSGPNDWKGIDLSEFDLVETCTDITSTFIGAGGVCGDGILNPSMGEQCEIGMKASYGSCVYSDASSVEYPGTFVIQCPNDCKYLPESQVNCQPTGFCGDGVLNGGEVCDNASFNGAYNNCSLDCLSEISAYGACGDGIIQENQGEVCDVWGNRCAFTNRTCSVGSESVDCEKVVDIYYKTVDGKQMVIVGVYSAGDDKVVSFVMPVEDLPAGIKTSDPEPCLKEQVQTVHASSKSESCNWDCKAFGPYCGDRLINGGEECDGDPIISETLNINVIEWCAPGKDKAYLIKGCTSDCKIEKSTDWECSETDPNAEVVYAPPPPTPPVPEKICGDASLQPEIGEECDNGVSNGNICSALYNSSCIYCSNTCKKITLTGGSCGDGVRQAQESCDNEDMSGVQCTDFGFTGGDLQCAPDCSFDKINCSI